MASSLDATDAECPGVQKRLRIWTFGLKTLDGFEYRGLGITSQIEELKAALQGGGVENVDLVFDVRTFDDPDCEVNRHIGAYPEIFEFLGSKLSKFSGELRSACLRITTPAAFHNLLDSTNLAKPSLLLLSRVSCATSALQASTRCGSIVLRNIAAWQNTENVFSSKLGRQVSVRCFHGSNGAWCKVSTSFVCIRSRLP